MESKVLGKYSFCNDEQKVGKLGCVLRVACDQEGEKVLIKSVDNELYDYVREFELMRECKHENVVKVLDMGKEEDGGYLVLEHLWDIREFNKDERLRYKLSKVGWIKETMRQLLVGLASLHEREVVHQDILPECLKFELNSNNFVVKLGDFGCARKLSTPPTVHIGSLGFRAPEVISKEIEKFGKGVDMWGAGVVFAVLLLGKKPFGGYRNYNLSWEEDEAKVMDKMKKLPEKDWSMKIEDNDAVNLLQGLLAWDPDKRLTAAQALKSMYFRVKPQDIEEEKEVVVPMVKEEKVIASTSIFQKFIIGFIIYIILGDLCILYRHC
ncbi:serine/threonine-protein kinase MAK [Selaginella moellendorffii]|nr:serine/threonine-protein kinase MAK [Selaginella moellendorffii]|eukprot:XP_002973636.2 serine/threonine-protein kinase MAK [Selaginella moellendorffii]